MFCRVTFLTPPVPLFFFSSSIFFYSTPDGGMPMACARSALEWPNSFYPENVFRVTLPRKSKFVGLNWVLFHALRSLDCSSRDFCCYTLQRTDYPPVILCLSLSLPLLFTLTSTTTTYSRVFQRDFFRCSASRVHFLPSFYVALPSFLSF